MSTYSNTFFCLFQWHTTVKDRFLLQVQASETIPFWALLSKMSNLWSKNNYCEQTCSLQKGVSRLYFSLSFPQSVRMWSMPCQRFIKHVYRTMAGKYIFTWHNISCRKNSFFCQLNIYKTHRSSTSMRAAIKTDSFVWKVEEQNGDEKWTYCWISDPISVYLLKFWTLESSIQRSWPNCLFLATKT